MLLGRSFVTILAVNREISAHRKIREIIGAGPLWHDLDLDVRCDLPDVGVSRSGIQPAVLISGNSTIISLGEFDYNRFLFRQCGVLWAHTKSMLHDVCSRGTRITWCMPG